MENIFEWRYGRNWYSTAKALKKASDKIREAYLVAYNQVNVPVRSSFSGTPAKIDGSKLADLDQYPIAMLLMGYAMENIFRGIIICDMWLEDPESVSAPNFADLLVPVKGGTTMPILKHNLRRLIAVKGMTNIKFEEPEKTMMDTLDMFIKWGGRYPTPKESDPSDPFGLKRLEPIEYPYQTLDSLYQKSMEELIRVCMLQGDRLSGDQEA